MCIFPTLSCFLDHPPSSSIFLRLNVASYIARFAMNETLIERFKRSKYGNKRQKDQVQILVLPQTLNNKVREYYEPTRRPSDAGGWFDYPEVPSSAEVLDSIGDSPSGPGFVELDPNRETGPWESKGKLSQHAMVAFGACSHHRRRVSIGSLRAAARRCSPAHS